MQVNAAVKNKLKMGVVTFWLSLLLHFLLLLGFSIKLIWWLPPDEKDLPSMYVPPAFVPSYMYREPSPSQPVAKAMPKSEPQPPPKKTDLALTKPKPPTATPRQEEIAEYPPKSQSARAQPQSQPQPVSLNDKNAEAINLVGDKKVVKPLLAILGRALAQHLFYPRIAIDFNLHGISYVGFMLHPNGLVSNVRIVKTSGEDILDKAAVTGVSAISPVRNVDPYIKKPEFIVAGIIFK